MTEALRKLLVDENFVTLLRAEGLDTLPATLPHALRPGHRPDMARKAATSTVKMASRMPRCALPSPTFNHSSSCPPLKKTPKYAQIAASIREVGIVEPPVVARDQSDTGKYLLLDGHLRIDVLKDMGETDVMCLVSTDDEAFTYNKRVNRLAMIQEHKMILKAVERGVPEERIAKALNVDVEALCESDVFWRESVQRLPKFLKINTLQSTRSQNCGRWCPCGKSRPPN